MTFLLLILAGIGFVALVLGSIAAMMLIPYSNATSGAGKLGVVVVCIGGSLFVVSVAGLLLFMVAFGMSNM